MIDLRKTMLKPIPSDETYDKNWRYITDKDYAEDLLAKLLLSGCFNYYVDADKHAEYVELDLNKSHPILNTAGMNSLYNKQALTMYLYNFNDVPKEPPAYKEGMWQIQINTYNTFTQLWEKYHE